MHEALDPKQQAALWAKLTPAQQDALRNDYVYGRYGWRIGRCASGLRKHGLVQDCGSLLTGAGMDMVEYARRRS